MARLGDFCTKQSSSIKQSDLDSREGNYPIYGASGFIKTVDFYEQDKPYVAVVKDGAGVGRVMKLPAYSSVIGTMQYIIPNDGVDVGYLAYAMEHMKLDKYYSGATIPHIYFKDYCKEPIKDTTEEEQKQIVYVLDLVSSLISLRKKQLQKLDDLVKSRFVEMFGDPKINPYNYLVASLGEHITFLTSGSRGWAKYCVEDGKEWFITIKNVKDCAISVENMQSINAPSGAEAERTRVQEGDLLISITADLGRTGVVTKHIAEHGAYINQHLTCIRLDMKVLNPLYVAYFMETPAGKEQFEAKNQSAVKAGLNFNSINSLRIIIPPIDKQNEFVTFVKHVDLSRLTIQNGLNKQELLKQSLMQKYFG